MMIEVFKEPEIQKERADALKSKEYREHLQKVITETVDSPLFKAKIQELLLKAAEEANSKSGEKAAQGGEQSGGNQSDQGQ
jgi:spore germination protein D